MGGVDRRGGVDRWGAWTDGGGVDRRGGVDRWGACPVKVLVD